MLKGSDLVAVHPIHGTVHELCSRHKLCCGNPRGKIGYKNMRRSTANAKANSVPCESLACRKARRTA